MRNPKIKLKTLFGPQVTFQFLSAVQRKHVAIVFPNHFQITCLITSASCPDHFKITFSRSHFTLANAPRHFSNHFDPVHEQFQST